LGGFSKTDPKQIPLYPPFSKGDLNAGSYLRISSKTKAKAEDKDEVEVNERKEKSWPLF
jgi:hypothetical protein